MYQLEIISFLNLYTFQLQMYHLKRFRVFPCILFAKNACLQLLYAQNMVADF